MANEAYQYGIPAPSTYRVIDGVGNEVSRVSENLNGYYVEFYKSRGSSRPNPDGFRPPSPYHFKRDTERLPIDGYISVKNKYPYNSGPDSASELLLTGNVSRYDKSAGAFNPLERAYAPKGTTQAMEDLALTRARLAMKGQSVDLGVAFAERNATARLLGDTASKIARSFTALKRGRWKDAARALGMSSAKKPRGSSVTNQWLEYQYGWNPLLQDVYGSAHALATREPRHWRVTGKGTVRNDYSEIVTIGSGDRSEVTYGVGTGSGFTGVFVRIDALPADSLLRAFSSLGLTNPGQIAWELLPYSFVVDWFLPIGDFISQIDAMLGYQQVTCSISHLEKFESRFLYQSSSWTHPLGEEFGSGSAIRQGAASRSYVALNRYVPDGVPMPMLPRLKDPVSLGHMANGLSLLASAFGRR
jgi:hypothetical protein